MWYFAWPLLKSSSVKGQHSPWFYIQMITYCISFPIPALSCRHCSCEIAVEHVRREKIHCVKKKTRRRRSANWKYTMESTASLLRGAIWRRWKTEGGSYSTNMCQPPTSQLSTPLIHLLWDPQWEFCRGKKRKNFSLLSTLAHIWFIILLILQDRWIIKVPSYSFICDLKILSHSFLTLSTVKGVAYSFSLLI